MGIFRNLQSVIRFRKPEFSRSRRRFDRAANIDDLRAIAQRRLPGGIFDYIDGAAQDEWSARNNVAAYSRIELRPRILRDVSVIDTSAMLLEKDTTPFYSCSNWFFTHCSLTRRTRSCKNGRQVWVGVLPLNTGNAINRRSRCCLKW